MAKPTLPSATSEVTSPAKKRAKPPADYRAIIAAENADAGNCAQMGRTFRRQGNLKAAIDCLRRAVDLSPAAELAQHLVALGETYLQRGAVAKAAAVFGQAIDAAPGRSRAYLFLSAIHRSRGERVKARQLLVTGIGRQPVVSPASGSRLPRVLNLRGIQNGYYLLGRWNNGQRKLKLRGGNFSGHYLVDKSRFDVINFMVLGGNLAEASDIPPFDAMVNAIADPDVEKASLETVAAFLECNPDTAIVNHPDKVLLTTRDENYRRLNDIAGVKFPLTVRLIVDEAVLADPVRAAGELGFEYPILMRDTGTQTGRTFERTNTPEEFCASIRHRAGKEIYLIQYVETLFRNEYFRKMRAFFIGGKIHPVVCHIDRVWNVHGSNRIDVMAANHWMIDEEKSCLADPRGYLGDAAYGILEKLPAVIGLDFFGVDFTIMGDGTFLIYELNPAMRHSFDHARNFPYLRPYHENISRAFSDMVERKIARARG